LATLELYFIIPISGWTFPLEQRELPSFSKINQKDQII